MAIVKFEPEEHEGALAEGFVIKRGTLLRSQLGKGERTACTFSTAHDVRLLPLALTEARYFTRDLAELNLPRDLAAKAALRLRLHKTIPEPFDKISVDPLILHIRGADELPGQIYEQIFAHKSRLVVQSPAGRKQYGPLLRADCIRRVGFTHEQALLPPAPRDFEGYRLLREYFAFPQRFLFFELTGFQEALAQVAGDDVDLVIVLDAPETRLDGRVDKTCFDLFCCPAINLFEKILIMKAARFTRCIVRPAYSVIVNGLRVGDLRTQERTRSSRSWTGTWPPSGRTSTSSVFGHCAPIGTCPFKWPGPDRRILPWTSAPL
jgi:type VI secretion system protein ImpG